MSIIDLFVVIVKNEIIVIKLLIFLIIDEFEKKI